MHPKILDHISQLAQSDLIPVMDTEISQLNILKPSKDLSKVTSAGTWHRSSFPFTFVLMLSNMDGTEGGETLLRGPSGKEKTTYGKT